MEKIKTFLHQNPEIHVEIQGHTDNVGDFEANINLSTERAKAVVNALIIDTGVKAEQLIPYGVGPVAPVATNTTDKGKAKNRRVEIVEQ